MNLYLGFFVWLCVAVRLYLALKIVGGGEPAAYRQLLCPEREIVGFPCQAPRLQLLLQLILEFTLLAPTSVEQ